jgi:hypothetical protein
MTLLRHDRFLKLNDAAEVAGITPRELKHLAEQGAVSFGFVPGGVRPIRRYRESEMLALRAQTEASFSRNGGRNVHA